MPLSREAERWQRILTPALWARTASNGRWQMARHLAMVDEALMALVAPTDTTETDTLDRLMVFMPPRHGKSELISRYFPAWYLGTHPDNSVILASHTQGLATHFGGFARNLLAEYGQEDFGVSVGKDTAAKSEWSIEGHRGGLFAAGVGGPITGHGADMFIIDDPVKDAEQAISPTYRQRNWDWWESTASTRLEPGSGVVLMNTRWHDDDLAGRLLKEEGDKTEGGKWHVISLPAIADPNDPMGRQPGEALWPERWPIEKINEIQRTKTPYWWGAMYQQRPGSYGASSWPAELFDDIWRPWPTEFVASTIAIDPAMGKSKKRGDYVAIVHAGCTRNREIHLDAWIERMPPDKTVNKAMSWYALRQPNLLTCEENGFQQLLGPMLKSAADKMGVFTYNPVPVISSTDKITRIEATLYPLLAAGKLKLRKGSPHTKLLYDQLRAIPHGDHDDGPDAAEMAVRKLVEWVQGGSGERVAGTVGGGY